MNENNEIMEMEQVTDEQVPEVYEETQNGMGVGVAMLIGSGLTIAAIAAVKKGKKVWEHIKSKRNAAKHAEEPAEVIDAEVIEAENDTDE